MLAAMLLLPRLLAGGAEPPADAIQLSVPRIERVSSETDKTFELCWKKSAVVCMILFARE